jgi:cob(I)alamin adenosyltransferase
MPKPIITTKFGDGGQTRTLGGETVGKDALIIECAGSVDAARAQIAKVRLLLQNEGDEVSEYAEFLLWVLHCLFLIGAETSDPERKHPEYLPDVITEKYVTALEAFEERLLAQLDLPRRFIVGATNYVAAETDLAAVYVRTLERRIVSLRQQYPLLDVRYLLPFVNRLSDVLFVLARTVEKGNHQAVDYQILERYLHRNM